jgi:alkylation response protein AidB-like acyl-CoA dehydrogenase
MGALLRRTAEYATTRRQFGVPIASFQAVAHRLADMKIAATSARATLLHTAALAEAGRATPRDTSVLKAQVGRLGRRVGEAAVQTHGGVGTTDELAIGHYLKRLLAIDAMFGDSEYHLRVIGAGTA